MDHPKVSICIPAYNAPELMRVCLGSISEQAFTDYEVVITDDSTDDTVGEVVNSFKYKIKNLRYYKNEARKGSPENWNESIRRAKGKYIKILHHDDWFSDKNSLYLFVELMEKNPTAYFGFCKSKACDSQQKIIYEKGASLLQLAKLKKNPACLFFSNFIGAPSATIYKNINNIYFDTRLKWAVDIDFYIRMLQKNKKFVFTDKPLISITAIGPDKITNSCQSNLNIELREYSILYKKLYKKLNFFKILKFFWDKIDKSNSKKINFDFKIPSFLYILLFMKKAKNKILKLIIIKK